MPHMSLAWIEAQIEHELDRGNAPDAVRDLAALIEVRRYMLEQQSARRASDDAHATPADAGSTLQRTTPGNECGPPTLDQIERAIGEVVLASDADRKRARDALTWVQIMRGDK